ncbi:hypothetical protein [Halanaerobaculum tunisiense]
MDPELIISISFMVVVIIEAIILLKNFFTDKEKQIFTKSLFRFLSNSFIYVAALLIFISSFNSQSGLQVLGFENLMELTLGQITIWIIIIADVVTLLLLGVGVITNLFSKDQEESTPEIINQQKAKELT